MEKMENNEYELAVSIADRYLYIQESETGFDYTIYDENYKDLDGGVLDNLEISIREALEDIINDLREMKYDPVNDKYYRLPVQGNIDFDSKIVMIDVEELEEKVDNANRIVPIAEEKKQEIWFVVAECSEFPSLGEYHEHLNTTEEAMKAYQSIPPERMHGLPSISITLHNEGDEDYMDDQVELLVHDRFDFDTLSYIPTILDNQEVVTKIAELVIMNPNAEIMGQIPDVVKKRVEELQAPKEECIELLAVDIDQFSMDYDPYEYRDSVDDRDANITMILSSIESGDDGYLREWLEDIIEQDEIQENKEHAKQLLQRLEHTAKIRDYKPLAKVEELEEGNYTRIDGIIDTSEKHNREEEKHHERCSIREKMAEKKAEIEQKLKKQSECSKDNDGPVRTQL